MYSVMWSEHCSYKSSKVHLRQFGEKAPQSDALLVGIGENAGVVDVGQGYAVTFKVESHNHPSYVEPYQGAATGCRRHRPRHHRDGRPAGGRGRPPALRRGRPPRHQARPAGRRRGHRRLRQLPGPAQHRRRGRLRRLLPGQPAGQRRCHRCDAARGHPPREASGASNKVILYGARTGGDGIGGASILASETFDDAKPSKRPAVQVGDPFQEKLLIECTLEAFREKLVVGIQDLGAAGLSCATSELASNGSGGMRVTLDDVPPARLDPVS